MLDLLVRAGDRFVRVVFIRAGRDDIGRRRREQDQDEEDRVRAWQRKAALLFTLDRRRRRDRWPILEIGPVGSISSIGVVVRDMWCSRLTPDPQRGCIRYNPAALVTTASRTASSAC